MTSKFFRCGLAGNLYYARCCWLGANYSRLHGNTQAGRWEKCAFTPGDKYDITLFMDMLLNWYRQFPSVDSLCIAFKLLQFGLLSWKSWLTWKHIGQFLINILLGHRIRSLLKLQRSLCNFLGCKVPWHSCALGSRTYPFVVRQFNCLY